jgi:starch phosphorylase
MYHYISGTATGPRRKSHPAIGNLSASVFSPADKNLFRAIVDQILGRDEFMLAADFDAYRAAQRSLDNRSLDENGWWRTSLLNTARMS